MAFGLTEIVGNDRAALTITVAGPEVTATGELELSLTCSSNAQDPVVVKVPVDVSTGEVHDDELPRVVKPLAPGAFSSHLQMYGELPPVNDPERLADWPASIAEGDAEGLLTIS